MKGFSRQQPRITFESEADSGIINLVSGDVTPTESPYRDDTRKFSMASGALKEQRKFLNSHRESMSTENTIKKNNLHRDSNLMPSTSAQSSHDPHHPIINDAREHLSALCNQIPYSSALQVSD